MAMVNIWVMWVLVCHLYMQMFMNMRLLSIPLKIMNVLVMNIMDMPVLMFKWFMMVLMFMVLCQMNPYADSHQKSR